MFIVCKTPVLATMRLYNICACHKSEMQAYECTYADLCMGAFVYAVLELFRLGQAFGLIQFVFVNTNCVDVNSL